MKLKSYHMGDFSEDTSSYNSVYSSKIKNTPKEHTNQQSYTPQNEVYEPKDKKRNKTKPDWTTQRSMKRQEF